MRLPDPLRLPPGLYNVLKLATFFAPCGFRRRMPRNRGRPCFTFRFNLFQVCHNPLMSRDITERLESFRSRRGTDGGDEDLDRQPDSRSRPPVARGLRSGRKTASAPFPSPYPRTGAGRLPEGQTTMFLRAIQYDVKFLICNMATQVATLQTPSSRICRKMPLLPQ